MKKLILLFIILFITTPEHAREYRGQGKPSKGLLKVLWINNLALPSLDILSYLPPPPYNASDSYSLFAFVIDMKNPPAAAGSSSNAITAVAQTLLPEVIV